MKTVLKEMREEAKRVAALPPGEMMRNLIPYTRGLREPTRRERLSRKVFGRWPSSYVEARLHASFLDEMFNEAIRREMQRRSAA